MSDFLQPKQCAIGLINLYDDVFTYLLLFLDGKDLSIMECVCTKMKKNNIMEMISYNLFKKYHPNLVDNQNKKQLLINGYIRLFEDNINKDINIPSVVKNNIYLFHYDYRIFNLLQKHVTFMAMRSNTFKYFYYLTKCYPTIQEINSRFKNQIAMKTSYLYDSHINYMMEKTLGCGNIILLINMLNYWKDNQIKVDKDVFAQRFMFYGNKIDHKLLGTPELDKIFRADHYDDVFIFESKMYVFKYHMELLKEFVPEPDYIQSMMYSDMWLCIEWGYTTIASELRTLNIPFKTNDPNVNMRYSEILRKIRRFYRIDDNIWEDIENPYCITPPHNADIITNELLLNKLDCRIAVYSIGKVNEWEKLKHLKYITQNKYYTQKQMAAFGKELINLNAVSIYIKQELNQWCDAHL